MPPSFYSSACPVFAVAWLGDRTLETEDPAYVLYSGGGGSTKSGVKNQIVVAKVAPSNNPAPTFDEVSTVETADRICSTFQVDKPRENNKAQLVAMGMGDMFMIYGITSTHELLPVSGGTEFSGKKENSKADVKAIAFETNLGECVATGDEDGIIRIIRMNQVNKVLKALANIDSSKTKDYNNFPKIQFENKVVELNGHRGSICSLHFNRNGQQLCSASKDGSCRIWDVAQGEELCVLPATSGLPPAYSKNKQVLQQMCRVAFFSQDGNNVFTLQNAARGSSYVTKWALRQGEDRKSGKKSKKESIEFTPVKTSAVADCPVTTMELSPCEKFIVTGNTRGAVTMIDSNSLKMVKFYEGHQLPVSCLSLSNPNSMSMLSTCSILTGSGDKTIIIGSLKTDSNRFSIMKMFCWILLFLFALFLFFLAPQLIEDAVMNTIKS